MIHVLDGSYPSDPGRFNRTVDHRKMFFGSCRFPSISSFAIIIPCTALYGEHRSPMANLFHRSQICPSASCCFPFPLNIEVRSKPQYFRKSLFRMKLWNISPTSLSAMKYPGSNALMRECAVGNGNQGAHKLSFKPLFVPSYTIRMSSFPFGTLKNDINESIRPSSTYCFFRITSIFSFTNLNVSASFGRRCGFTHF